jgi:iron complex transport system substrate-binding protein
LPAGSPDNLRARLAVSAISVPRGAALAAALLFSGAPLSGLAEIRVTDDTGTVIRLPKAARRIVSLAPSVTELLYAAGAGPRIVATTDYSDYPAAAMTLPRIGSSAGLDVERIVALKPDLVVAWVSGNPRAPVERLRKLGLTVYRAELRHMDDIGRALEQLGKLAGTERVAQAEADGFRAASRALAARYADRPRVRLFYQVLDPLLITFNGEHLVSEIMRLCGGDNVFADLPVLAPIVSEESVLRADPEAIVAGGTDDAWSDWRRRWQRHTGVTAVKRGALYFIPADVLHRQGPRVIEGAERLCLALEDARRRR